MKTFHPLKTFLLTMLLATLLAACGSPGGRELAGMPIDESGIGGTGILAGEDGIGGTGIVGTITGFGSIFVNGVEVEITAETQLVLDGKRVTTHEFQRGEVVALRVSRQGRQIVAQEAFIDHLLIGRVDSVDAQRRSASILDQQVFLGELPLPRTGSVVAVSGFRDARGVIHATRLAATQATEFMLTGVPVQRGGTWYIGKMAIPATGLSAGQRVRVWGQRDRGTPHSVLRVTRMQALADLPFTRTVTALIWQGIAQRITPDRIRLGDGPLTADLPATMRKTLPQGKPVRLVLRGEGMRWRALLTIPTADLPMGRPQAPAWEHHMPGGSGMPSRPPMRPPMRSPGGMW